MHRGRHIKFVQECDELFKVTRMMRASRHWETSVEMRFTFTIVHNLCTLWTFPFDWDGVPELNKCNIREQAGHYIRDGEPIDPTKLSSIISVADIATIIECYHDDRICILDAATWVTPNNFGFIPWNAALFGDLDIAERGAQRVSQLVLDEFNDRSTVFPQDMEGRSEMRTCNALENMQSSLFMCFLQHGATQKAMFEASGLVWSGDDDGEGHYEADGATSIAHFILNHNMQVDFPYVKKH